MEPTIITVRAHPDDLVKIYDETRDEVLSIDNADTDGTTAPVTLPTGGGHYFVDITTFDPLPPMIG